MPETRIDHIDEQPDVACHHSTSGCVDRRWLLRGGVGLAAGAALVACGDGGGASSTDSDDTDTDDPGDSGDAGAEDPAGAAGPLAATGDIPVGGGAIFSDSEVVVTQPAEGDFKAFSSVCTHQGCQVTEVTETINCPCHGSTFSIEDGSPTGGPAPSALEELQINVEGDQISLV